MQIDNVKCVFNGCGESDGVHERGHWSTGVQEGRFSNIQQCSI